MHIRVLKRHGSCGRMEGKTGRGRRVTGRR